MADSDGYRPLQCFFCREPAATISYGFAICDGREETPINCSERAHTLFMKQVWEASRGATW